MQDFREQIMAILGDDYKIFSNSELRCIKDYGVDKFKIEVTKFLSLPKVKEILQPVIDMEKSIDDKKKVLAMKQKEVEILEDEIVPFEEDIIEYIDIAVSKLQAFGPMEYNFSGLFEHYEFENTSEIPIAATWNKLFAPPMDKDSIIAEKLEEANMAIMEICSVLDDIISSLE